MQRTLVLKLGGSLVTDKSRPYCLRAGVLKAVSKEIKECLDLGLVQRLAIVHGVGSYGHPPVIQYKLHKGFVDPGQLLPISCTQSKVNELRGLITAELQGQGIPVNLFHTSSIAISERGKMIDMDLRAVKGFMDIGMVPVLGGDMVYDLDMGFSVGSGDQVAAILARELGATDLVLATDVAGVFNADPKANADAQLLKELSLSDLRAVDFSLGDGRDASGTMRGKLSALAVLEPELREGLKLNIVSMMRPGRLKALLQGDEGEATMVRP